MPGSDEGDMQPKVPPTQTVGSLSQGAGRPRSADGIYLFKHQCPVILAADDHHLDHHATGVPLRLAGLRDNRRLHARFRCRSVPASIACFMSTALFLLMSFILHGQCTIFKHQRPGIPCRPAICSSSCVAADQKDEGDCAGAAV